MNLRFLLPVFCLLSACSDPRSEAQTRLQKVNVPQLRSDAARLYKQLYASPGPEFMTLKQSLWPESFKQLRPLRIGVYRDGFSLALQGEATAESGLHVAPLGLDQPPKPGRAKYERLADGVFWYSLGK